AAGRTRVPAPVGGYASPRCAARPVAAVRCGRPPYPKRIFDCIARDAGSRMTTSALSDHATSRPALVKPSGIERFSEAISAYLLVTPGAALLAILFVVPVAAVFVIATTNWQFGAAHLVFVGTKNFREVFADPPFRTSLLNTIVYALIVVPGTIGLGLL